MFEQTSGNDSRRKRAFWPAGALGLLLALALVAGGMLPALAQIPATPHGFAGTVSTLDPPQLVPGGTRVEALVGGVVRTEAYVDAEGRYEMLVRGTVPADTGKTVTFRVAGVLAQQTSLWESGETQILDLTIPAMPGDPMYGLTMAVAPAGSGNATDLTSTAPYGAGIEVDIGAVATTGYGFVNWTAVPAVVFADAKAEQTSFTMPAANVTVTGNFAPAYALTMAVSPAGGGSAIDVKDRGEYAANGTVSIKAQANAGYEFVNWTAAPAVEFVNATAAETTFTMIGGPVTITANFQASGHTLQVKASPIVGGTVSVFPVQALYQAGTQVQVQASPASGYQFSQWTPTVPGIVENPSLMLTKVTMPAQNAEVTAIFTLVQTGGSVCFIATAAYGTPGAEQIDVLREFRDKVLLNSAPGSHFVALYYRLSPPAAEVISGNGFLRTMVRELLVDPVVWMVEATGDLWRD